MEQWMIMTRFNNTLKDWASSIWTFYVYIFSFFKCHSFKQSSAYSFLIILTIHFWLNFIISSGYYISPINCFLKKKKDYWIFEFIWKILDLIPHIEWIHQFSLKSWFERGWFSWMAFELKFHVALEIFMDWRGEG